MRFYLNSILNPKPQTTIPQSNSITTQQSNSNSNPQITPTITNTTPIITIINFTATLPSLIYHVIPPTNAKFNSTAFSIPLINSATTAKI